MRTYIIILSVFLSHIFINDPCERNVKTKDGCITYIYPMCNDSLLYIKRTSIKSKDSLVFSEIIEELFKNGMCIEKSEFIYLDGNYLIGDEFVYDNSNKVIQQSRVHGFNIHEKNFQINDSLEFNVQYYNNGFIKSYGQVSDCPIGKQFEKDSLQLYTWTGYTDKPKIDSSTAYYGEVDSLIVVKSCGKKSGIWRKFDANQKVVDSAIYIDGIRIRVK